MFPTLTTIQIREILRRLGHTLAPSDDNGTTTQSIASPAPDDILSLLKRYLRLTFVVGPKVLLTSRISGKCAALMFMLCSPSLLFCMVLTVPALLFKSPQQHAYFYFSTMINQDPSRWVVLVLAAICTILALAVPATMSPPRSSVGSFE